MIRPLSGNAAYVEVIGENYLIQRHHKNECIVIRMISRTIMIELVIYVLRNSLPKSQKTNIKYATVMGFRKIAKVCVAYVERNLR